MFYVLFILLFIIFFMLYQHHKERHTIPFTLVLVAYFFAILSMMIYYSRDAYYYNVIKNYSVSYTHLTLPTNREV